VVFECWVPLLLQGLVVCCVERYIRCSCCWGLGILKKSSIRSGLKCFTTCLIITSQTRVSLSLLMIRAFRAEHGMRKWLGDSEFVLTLLRSASSTKLKAVWHTGQLKTGVLGEMENQEVQAENEKDDRASWARRLSWIGNSQFLQLRRDG